MPIILVILSNATIVFIVCGWRIPVVSSASVGPEEDLTEGNQNWLHVVFWKCCQCPIPSQRREKGAKKLQSRICASIYYMSNISKVHLTIHASFIYCPCGEKKISKKLQSLIKFTLLPPTGRQADFLQPLNGSRNFTFLPQSFPLLSTLALMIPCMSLVNSKLCRGGKSCPTFIILSSSALSRSPQLPSGKNI